METKFSTDIPLSGIVTSRNLWGSLFGSASTRVKREPRTPEQKAYRIKRRQQNQRAKRQRQINRKRG